MNLLEAYILELREIWSSRFAVEETSCFGLLTNLLKPANVSLRRLPVLALLFAALLWTSGCGA